MALQDDIALLQLYNERASELHESSFLREIRESPRVSFHLSGGPFHAVREGGPSRESMKAFVLTFRLFLQDRDGLSFRTIDRRFATLPVSAQLREEVAAIRADVNAYLDGRSPFVIDGTAVTRRELLDAWMYGEVAHVNANRRATLRHWRVEDDVRPFWQHEFEMVILQLVQFVFCLRQVNLRAVAELTSSG